MHDFCLNNPFEELMVKWFHIPMLYPKTIDTSWEDAGSSPAELIGSSLAVLILLQIVYFM